MSKSLPPYEKLVRWSIKEVTDWLTQVNLGNFKDQFCKQNIDGSRLTKLSDFDVDNFIGREKKKTELKNFISNIQKPKNTQSKPTWISPTPRQQQSHVPDDDSDNDSIYSWGDDFSDEGGDNHVNNDEETYMDIKTPIVDNYEVPEDNTESTSFDSTIILSLQSALTEFHANRNKSSSRLTGDDAEPADDVEDYLFPIKKEQAPPLPKNRGPLPTPTPTSIPLLPGQIIPTSSTTKKDKTIPRPLNESTAKKGAKLVTPISDVVYDDPDAKPEPRKNKTAQSKPPGRRRPPPIPPTEPEGELYMNESEIKTEKNGSYSKTEEHESSNSNDGYIKFQPGPPQQQQQDIYIDPEDEPVLEPSKKRTSLPTIPSPKNIPSERKISLPPIPSSSKRLEDKDALSNFDWYHHDADRKEAEDRLKANKSDGMFLVRKSAKGGKVHPYTLMLFYNSKVFNFPVRQQDGQFALGKESKPDDLNFPSVPELIQYFQKTTIILNQGWTTKLSKPLEKLL